MLIFSFCLTKNSKRQKLVVTSSPKKGRGQKGFPTNSLSESRICGGPAEGRRGRCFEAPEFIRGEDNKTWSEMRSTRYNTSLLETPKFIYGVSFSIAAYLRKPLCVYVLLPSHLVPNNLSPASPNPGMM